MEPPTTLESPSLERVDNFGLESSVYVFQYRVLLEQIYNVTEARETKVKSIHILAACIGAISGHAECTNYCVEFLSKAHPIIPLAKLTLMQDTLTAHFCNTVYVGVLNKDR